MPAETFGTAMEWRIARHLAIAPRTQGELAQLTGADRRTLRDALKALRERDLVDLHETSGEHVGRGHHRGMWSLRGESPRVAFGERVQEPPRAGCWRAGQTWVRATAPADRIADLMSVLAEPDLTVGASWVCQLDGPGRVLFVAFEGALGSQPADRLFIALQAAKLECDTGTVRAVDDPDAAAAQAETVVGRAQGVRV